MARRDNKNHKRKHDPVSEGERALPLDLHDSMAMCRVLEEMYGEEIRPC